MNKNEKHPSLFKLKNRNGLSVSISDFGCRLISILTPDKNGCISDILLGYQNLEDCIGDENYFGAVIGRVANVIRNGQFKLNGKKYQLNKNFGKHTIHGGNSGFDQVFWEVEEHSGYSLKLYYLSKDGEENFPGNLNVWVEYRLTNDNCLELEFTAQTNQDTIINLTSHPYFNLGGHDYGSIGDHEVWINADSFVPVSDEFIPIGGFFPVSNSPFDLQDPKLIQDVISSDHKQLKAVSGGFDHSFCLNKKGNELMPAATITHPKSGRVLNIFTSEPALHFYTANTLNVTSEKGKEGTAYAGRSAFCLEPQHFPDSVNQDNFPTTILKANQFWKSKSIFKFDVTNNNCSNFFKS